MSDVRDLTGPLCRSSFYTDTGRTQHPGDREIRCDKLAGHTDQAGKATVHEERDSDGAGHRWWPPRTEEPTR